MKVKNCRIIKLPTIKDEKDGCLSIAEGLRNIPFEIKRIYYIYNLNKESFIRGEHAHKKLQQVLFCINGSCFVDLDDGTNKKTPLLYAPNVGIYMGPLVWHKVGAFSKGCILLVLASDFYDESDYIRSYPEFLEYIK